MGSIHLDQVVKRFGTFTAVRSLDLEITKGEFLAIMGPSGCGKTTTLRMLAGLERPSAGEIRLNGRRMNEVKAMPEARQNMPPRATMSRRVSPLSSHMYTPTHP